MYEREFTDTDGRRYKLRVFSTMYLDWGLEILRAGIGGEWTELFYSPSALSLDSYGITWTDDDGQELDEGISWTQEQWAEHFTDYECGELVDAYTEHYRCPVSWDKKWNLYEVHPFNDAIPLVAHPVWSYNPCRVKSCTFTVRSHSSLGGYPLAYVTGDNGVLCPACVQDNIELTSGPEWDEQWRVVSNFVNYEDTLLHCDHCSQPIESAYGDDSEDS